MTNPPRKDDTTARELAEKCFQPLTRPTPLWGFFLAAVLGAFALWWVSGTGDQVPKRWNRVNEEKQSDLYNALVDPPSLATCDPASPQCSDAPIPTPHHNWNKPHVAVYSLAAMRHPLPTLRDLGDLGQARAIEFLGKTTAVEGKSWAQLRNALSDSGASDLGEKDPFQFDRVLVATVAKGASWYPADRMMWTRVFVQPINFVFAGYIVAETDNKTVKVTSVEATNSRKFSADIGLTTPGVEGPKATIGPSGERSVKTTSDITAQYEKLGIDIMPQFLRIIRESETGGDVVGNTRVSLSIVTDALTIQKRFPQDDSHRDPMGDDIVLLVTGTHLDDEVVPEDNKKPASDENKKPIPISVLPQVPVPHCALRARVWMLYEERRVDGGRESYDESRQAVSLLRDAESKEDLDIMNADEVSPAVWSLQICDRKKCDGKDYKFLQAHAENGQWWRNVVFTDYGQAVKLAHWLRTTQRSNIPGSNLTFNYPSNPPNTKEGLVPAESLVPVKKLHDECKPEKTQIMSRE
jgi:hypothetical protein